jgi:riboflavin kinase/FMN adenylyltransferase
MQGGVFALGNFDGVHRGHQRVVDVAMQHAQSLGVPTRILTFEPHPKSIFQPNTAPFRLTPFEVKERLLKSFGVDDVIALPFTHQFSQMIAVDFVKEVLLNQLRVDHVVAGHDFTFGHKRGGDMRKLGLWLAEHKVGVSEVAPVVGDKGVFSSSYARSFLQEGDVRAAIDILGHDWSIAGTIIKGAQRGRTIGTPTANISLGEYLRPKFGVYAVQAGRVGEPLTYSGVANIGRRPTVDGHSENLEAHLFDFDQEIYGQEWEFALKRFIRAEQKFDSLDSLKAQIQRDIEAARAE